MPGLLRRKGEIWIPQQRRNAARTACAVRTTRACARSVRECGGTRRKGRLFIAKEKSSGPSRSLFLSCFAHGNALSDVGTFFRFIHHGGGVVGVAHAALAPAVDRQFFSADQIAARFRAVRLKIRGGTHVGPAHVVPFPQSFEGFAHGAGQRFPAVRECGGVHDAHRAGGVRV